MDELDLVGRCGMVDGSAPVGAGGGRVCSLPDRRVDLCLGLFRGEDLHGAWGAAQLGINACELDLRRGNRLPLQMAALDFEGKLLQLVLRCRLTCQAERNSKRTAKFFVLPTQRERVGKRGISEWIVQGQVLHKTVATRDNEQANIVNTTGDDLLFYFLGGSLRFPSCPLRSASASELGSFRAVPSVPTAMPK